MCVWSEGGEEKCEKLQLRKRRKKNFPHTFSQAFVKTNTLVADIEMDEEEQTKKFFVLL